MLEDLAFRWLDKPCDAEFGDERLALAAGSRTDLFTDPRGNRAPVESAPALVTPMDGDFLLSARVAVDFAAGFDAGGLLVNAGEGMWAKLCFECTPSLEPTVVSVVTRGFSDDCTSFPVAAREIRLRIARMGPALAFHAALDGNPWHLVRHFALQMGGMVEAGFVAQSPTGDGCTVRFTEISFEVDTTLADIRSGD